MAEGKKSFLLYTDLIHVVEKLSDEQAGKLMKHLLRYVNDQDPVMDDFLLDIVFEPIKQTLKRQLKEWEEVRKKRIESGKIGGINSGKSRGKKQNKANEASASKTKQTKQDEANEAVNVNGNVSVNVNDSVNVIEKRKKEKKIDDTRSSFQLCVDFWLKTFHPGWKFNATTGKHLKTIISNLENELKATGRDPTPETVAELFQAFCEKLPDWFKDKDLQILNSKYNEIITEIRKRSTVNDWSAV